jgi:cytochrome bd-type quinol oxidase subunit 2
LDFENTAFDFSNLKELYETMAKIHLPQKINMRDLMSITKSRTYQTWHSYLILTAILLVVGIVFYLGYTYIKFNCKKNPFRRIKKPEDNQENIPLE